ncbi:twin-arginine translocation signal domain-containing protein [Woeseia oceani]|uniref:Neutral/alkaline non-lysosomal ceramidase N-terminal domain-containing protein n=1 Tax=Woeseia oceani TaxID=1548547 RepID=A0A193LD66_9GAMM|nr:twin-arginine translocation signal domain-containing protein [Woeseia oceani]ANO50452.1 hypothetical protein BA177_03825 [Woeseia oceani]
MNQNRRRFLQSSVAAGAATAAGLSWSNIANALGSSGKLEVAAIRFGTQADLGDRGASLVGSKIGEIASPLKTTVMLFKDGATQVCLVAWDLGNGTIEYTKDLVSRRLGISRDNVVVCASHNHSGAPTGVSEPPFYHYASDFNGPDKRNLTPFGKRLFGQIDDALKRLPKMLEPVTVWHAEGSESRITYCRKGYRADGSTFFMREEDRVLYGKDFNGDIDRQAPIVVFKSAGGRPVAGLVQFTGHPVTSYQPEQPVVFGDYPQVATDIVGRELAGGSGEPVPVGFLQGCAGDVNSKEMFVGGVERAIEFGEMLGSTYVNALSNLKESDRPGMNFTMAPAAVPCGELPSVEVLRAEIAEMQDFIKRADAGDENTLGCVGLNFPRALTPKYRGALIKAVLPWNEWALDLRRTGRTDEAMKAVDMPVAVMRLGDVGILGLSCEPFQGIGRRFRELSPLPLSIPCGYTNGSHGYITDSPNTGDREYMSAFYRYTKFRPPLAKPAGNVLADSGVNALKAFL